VAAALPGGDPVAAALAAGETPSPAMVAAAGTDQGLRPAVGVALLVAFLAGLATLVALSPRTHLTNQVPLPKRPEVLAQDARNILATLGHTAEPADSAHGFTVDQAYLDHLEEEDESPTRWDALAGGRPGAIHFWYRQSPRSLEPVDMSWAQVSPNDPPFRISGMANMMLDSDGRLLSLKLVPRERDESTDDAAEVDWSVLLASAGLRAEDLEPAEPRWNPEVYCDHRAAWTGSYPDNDAIPIRVEAGAYRGKAVYFRVILPWTQPTRMEEEEITAGERVAQFLGISIFFLVPLIVGLLLARRNLRLGRSDRKGAFRLAAFYLVVHTIVWVFTAKHVPNFPVEFSIFISALGSSLWQAFMLYVIYIALEPYVRRRWPDALVSWTRVLAGRFRDPLVGRDILVGATVGTGLSVFFTIGFLAPQWLGRAPGQPNAGNLSDLLGVPRLLGNTIDALVHAQVPAMAILFVFLLLRILLRRQWLAGAVLFALILTLSVLGDENPWIAAALTAVAVPLVLFTLTRFGLLAMTVMFYFLALIGGSPLTSDVGAWYAGPTILLLVVTVGLAAYGFYLSLAGRPLVSGDLFGD
jgi:serine/threonine-protein kinase